LIILLYVYVRCALDHRVKNLTDRFIGTCFCCEFSQVFMDMTEEWKTGAELSASFTVEVGDLDEAGQLL